MDVGRDIMFEFIVCDVGMEWLEGEFPIEIDLEELKKKVFRLAAAV